MIQTLRRARFSQREARVLASGWSRGQPLLQQGDALALLEEAGLGGLVGLQQALGQFPTDAVRQPGQQLAGVDGLLVHRQAQAQAELGVVFEEGIVPARPPALRVGGVGGGGQIAAVDGGTAGGVGDQHAVAEELGRQLDVGGLAAPHAGPGEGSTPDTAKKQVCMMVLMRPPMPDLARHLGRVDRVEPNRLLVDQRLLQRITADGSQTSSVGHGRVQQEGAALLRLRQLVAVEERLGW
jgi:hypothetical protein